MYNIGGGGYDTFVANNTPDLLGGSTIQDIQISPIDIGGYNASGYFQDYLNQGNSFSPITAGNLFETHGVPLSNINPFDQVGAEELQVLADDFGVDISDDYYDLGLGAGDMAREVDGDPFVSAIFNDASTLSQTELNLLDDTGVVDYDKDGQLVLGGTDAGVGSVNEVIAAIDAKIGEGKLSNSDVADLNQLKTELNHSIDMGIGAVSFGDATDMPIGSERTFDNAGYDQYTDPYYYKPYSTVSPGLKTPMLGNTIFSGPKGDPSYVGDYGNGRVGPTMEGVYGRPVENLGQLTYGEAFAPVNPNAAAQAAARREYANALGTPNMFDQSGVRVNNRIGLNDRFDSFTDFLSDGVTTILSPLDALAGGIGQGFAKVGGMVGDNVVGRGISNFGRVIDGTGNFLFNEVPNTVINYPDNIANIGSGLYRTLTGADMGIGQPTNTGLLMGGLKGLVTQPLKLGLNALSIPLSVASDVFGVNRLSVGASGRGGGGGGGKKKKSTARRSVPIVRNKDGSIKRGSTGSGGSGTSVGAPSRSDGSGMSGSGDGSGSGSGSGDGSGGGGDTFNVDAGGDSGSGSNSAELKTSEADKSQVGEQLSEQQGDPGVTATQPAQPQNWIDEAAGEGIIEVELEEGQSLAEAFANPPDGASYIKVPQDYNFTGGSGFTTDSSLYA